MKSKSVIVFDMDGVLIDVSGSYRETARLAARLFFKSAKSWEALPDPLFSLADLSNIKQSGGLNNDWDLTVCVIELLSSLIDSPKTSGNDAPWQRYENALSGCDMANLLRFLNTSQTPLTDLLEKHGKVPKDFIRRFYQGDVGTGNIIKQIFQEIYLGNDLFQSTYGFQARVYTGEGYLNRESLLIDAALLESLSEHHILAIATGRPKAEADYPLDLNGIGNYFSMLYTLDDCLKAEDDAYAKTGKVVSLSKPNPYMLDAISEQAPENVTRFYYIGDMPDDMVAAQRSKAGYIGIGMLQTAPHKAHLKADLISSGADYIINYFSELKDIIGDE